MRAVVHAHWRIRMGHRQIFPRTLGAGLPRTMSPRLGTVGGLGSVRAELMNETDVQIDVSCESCEIRVT